MEIFHHIQAFIDIFARGGGGGSGGGGGGGGGGSSGGSGGGGDGGGWGILGLLGFLPPYYFGAFLRKRMKNPVGLSLMIIGTMIYGMVWWLIGFWGVLVSLAAFLGGPVGYFGWFSGVTTKLRKKADKEVIQAASKDSAWDITALTNYVTQVFYAYQEDWSKFNIERIKGYTTQTFGHYNHLMLAAIHLRNRKNVMENVKLIETFPIEAVDSKDNTQDRVTFYIRAEARDKIIETIEGKDTELFVDNNEFYEKWNFVRSGDTWLFDSIEQFSENWLMKRPEIESFASQNSMYYSADWGWLLLPSRGQLFGRGKFGTSDINNHVVGMYNNLLVELYTYIANPNSDTNGDNAQYLIAQVALPKRYDSLIVEAKGSTFEKLIRRTPKGYNNLTLEWPDFNKRYRVFATNVEQVTAFELLHPVYMEKLFALPFKVSIEVVDNVLYLYTKDKKADYAVMYSILKDAFEEMKL